mmetsp:Transcript_29735/g.96904  ORF Transcript_29735/g.96904 Transcript_29735/m.96904 type:complete len:218 (-) Transcript_29735:2164-2817(-)
MNGLGSLHMAAAPINSTNSGKLSSVSSSSAPSVSCTVPKMKRKVCAVMFVPAWSSCASLNIISTSRMFIVAAWSFPSRLTSSTAYLLYSWRMFGRCRTITSRTSGSASCCRKWSLSHSIAYGSTWSLSILLSRALDDPDLLKRPIATRIRASPNSAVVSSLSGLLTNAVVEPSSPSFALFATIKMRSSFADVKSLLKMRQSFANFWNSEFDMQPPSA